LYPAALLQRQIVPDSAGHRVGCHCEEGCSL
jgi:hypothetical protein